MRTHLLLDADVLAYQCAQYNEIITETEPGYWTWHCEFSKVKDSIKWYIDGYMEKLKGDTYTLALTDYSHNFRKDILSTYKGNRSNLKKPLVLKPTREYLLEEGALIWPSLEGDDILGIMSTEPTDENRIVVSIDKDMQTLPCSYYSPNTGVILNITEEEADYYHLYQTLIGDTTDGYSGCPTYGPVSAKKVLDKDPTWSAVVKAYQSKGLTEEDALVQARVAKILRHENYNRETKEPILWTPNMEVTQ